MGADLTEEGRERLQEELRSALEEGEEERTPPQHDRRVQRLARRFDLSPAHVVHVAKQLPQRSNPTAAYSIEGEEDSPLLESEFAHGAGTDFQGDTEGLFATGPGDQPSETDADSPQGPAEALLREDTSGSVATYSVYYKDSTGEEFFRGNRHSVSQACSLLATVIRELPPKQRQARATGAIASTSGNGKSSAAGGYRSASRKGSDTSTGPMLSQPSEEEMLEGLIGRRVTVGSGQNAREGKIVEFDNHNISWLIQYAKSGKARTIALPSRQVYIAGVPERSRSIQQATTKIVDLADQLPFNAFEQASSDDWKMFQSQLTLSNDPQTIANQVLWFTSRLKRSQLMNKWWRSKYESELSSTLNAETMDEPYILTFAKHLQNGLNKRAVQRMWDETQQQEDDDDDEDEEQRERMADEDGIGDSEESGGEEARHKSRKRRSGQGEDRGTWKATCR